MTPAEDEDEGDDLPGRMPDAFPTAIRVAGILWIISGSLGLLGLALAFGEAAGQGGVTDTCGPPCVCGPVELIFLLLGIETVRWRIRGVVASGVVSIVIGSIYVAMAVLGITRAGNDEAYLVAAFIGALALSLMVAGALALIGWYQYGRARVAAGLERPRDMTQDEADYDG